MAALRRPKAAREEAGTAGAKAPGNDAEVPGYRLLEAVGYGGFSTVYQAHQEALDRMVAVKVLTVTQADDRVRQRFLREVRLTTRLGGHPHVVTVLDAGITRSGQPYIAMDYYEHGSLHDQLTAQGPLPAAEVAAIGVKVGGALAAAHELGILHRDIKPQNILVSRFGEPALADFGVALLASAAGSASQTEALTPCHAAPEILEGAEPSAAADIYSLGSTLYELLAGRPAYQRESSSIGPLVMRILHEPPPPLDRPDAPEALRAAVLRAMSRDPAGRFATAASLAAALAPFASPPDAGTAAATAPRQQAGLTAARLPHVPAAGPGAAAETRLRPGREDGGPAANGAGSEDGRARAGWLGGQLALAAVVIAALAAGGVFLGLRHTTAVRHAATVRHGGTPHAAGASPTASQPTPTATAAQPSPSLSGSPAPSVPSAPQQLTVTATANHSITLAWSPPASGGAPASYDVSWTGAVSGSNSAVTGTSFQITGLANSATYSLSVSAVNTAGTSQPATVSQALTPPPSPFNTFRNTQLPLLVDARPDPQSGAVATIPVLTGNLGPQVIVECQVTGATVTDPVDGNLSGNVWDKVSYQGVAGYISDLYVNTPQSVAGNFGAFSDPPLWECN